MEKDLKVKVADLNTAIFETQVELEDLMMTLIDILERYDSGCDFEIKDVLDYEQGNMGNKKGKAAFTFLHEYKRIMWLVRTARMYCEQAQKICESTEI
ncbi:hypothetical protein [Dorea formicigenerans]|uniref:Uncharacterized protein n=1 Tax=Dorea formicigenerans TaxID=39486 RepID=A0A415U8A7_9FIRM|nr:hypothetical protein [Dorea formicigenerans]RHN14231.1 hypothetical protein DWZ24_13025 [Dorea formicigenerans]